MSNLTLLTDVLTRILTVALGGWLINRGFSQDDALFITTGAVTLIVAGVFAIYRNFALRNQTPPTKGDGQL